MARPSPLTAKQWEEVAARYLRGESARALGREFGVGESTIRARLSAQSAQVKSVANQVLAAERAFNELNYSAQVRAQSLIDELRAISMHLAGAAKLGSMTAHRLSGLAHQQVGKLDDADPLADIEKLKGINALVELANKSAQTGFNLLAANKAMIDADNDKRPGPYDDIRVIELVGQDQITDQSPA